MAQIVKRTAFFTFKGFYSIRQLQRTIFTELRPEELTQPVIQCRNRPFLAGGDSNKLPEYLSRDVNKYFTGIKVAESNSGRKATTDVTEVGKEFRRYVDDNITNYSAFLLKGGIENAEDFGSFVSGVGYKSYFYDAGTAARSTVGDYVYTASDEPPEISIESHNEMSYLEKQPTKVSTIYIDLLF